MSLHIGVLGPLEVRLDGWVRPIPAGKLATFVAAMALQANRVVALPALAEELWGATPPRSARHNLRSYASQARRLLGDPDRLVARGDGYVLVVEPGEVDAERFETTVGDASAADPSTACELLEAALGLWRGPVAVDVTAGSLISVRADVLDELRVVAVEEHTAALLRQGTARPAELAVRLRQHLTEHPYRERAWCQLMFALYRAGDPASALEAHETASRILAVDLGIAPGPELDAMHRAVRDRDASLSDGITTGPPAWAGEPFPVPHQVPPVSPWLIGHAAELQRVCQALRPGDTPPVVVVTGPPGAGKSALAIAAAHRVADSFPDGQLYADLSDAVGPEQVLVRFLQALRCTSTAQVDPAELRTAAFGRRLLVILDNADGFARMESLVPTGPGCAVLITRRSLPGWPGGVQVPLGRMPLPDARELVARVTCARPGPDDGAAVNVLAERCDGLPIAVRAAAMRLARRPDRSVATLAARLRPLRFRLDELGGDVRAHLARACRTLGAGGTAALRRLSLLRVPVYRLPVLAVLLDSSVREADAILDLLVTEHIVEPLDTNRFRLSGLLRAYGAELVRAEPGDQRQAALLRAFHWYGAGADHAASTARTAWLEAEWENLLAVARQAARVRGAEADVRRIADALGAYLCRTGRDQHTRLLRRLARIAARRVTDQAAGDA